VIGRKGTIGEVTWLHKNFYPIDTTFYIQDKLGLDNLLFHYFLLKEQDFKKIASDSAVPGLNRNHAMENRVIIPDKSIIETFHQTTKAIFEAKNEIEHQAKTLTQLRDNLLPKLMKGKIST
jgi:type I restriction enzyme S subunit